MQTFTFGDMKDMGKIKPPGATYTITNESDNSTIVLGQFNGVTIDSLIFENGTANVEGIYMKIVMKEGRVEHLINAKARFVSDVPEPVQPPTTTAFSGGRKIKRKSIRRKSHRRRASRRRRR